MEDKRMGEYDVFISYRRDGGDMTATRLYNSLVERRYRVFLDVKKLGPGKYERVLLEVIRKCRVFMPVLSRGSLDRCTDENDWVRREIECAIYNGISIIPVMLPDFCFPGHLPVSVQQMADYNGVVVSANDWNVSIDKLERFLILANAQELDTISWETAYQRGKVLYDQGDYEHALPYLKKAAEGGSGEACNQLALIYFGGRSIPPDKKKALKLFQKGAAQYGNKDCMGNLGIMYQYGHGTDIDYDLALEWYLKAMGEGNGSAARYAGDMYRDGIGVPGDTERARELYRRAVGLGDAKAKECLDALQ